MYSQELTELKIIKKSNLPLAHNSEKKGKKSYKNTKKEILRKRTII